MFLLQITQAPFILYVADEKGQPAYHVQIPKYTLEEAIAYGAELFDRWRTKQQEGMTDAQKRDFEAMYPTAQATISDIKRAIASLDGAKEVIAATFPRAKVFKAIRTKTSWKKGEEVSGPNLEAMLEKVLTGNGSGTLCRIAWEIADLEDHSMKLPPEITPAKDSDDDEEEDVNPLTDTGRKD